MKYFAHFTPELGNISLSKLDGGKKCEVFVESFWTNNMLVDCVHVSLVGDEVEMMEVARKIMVKTCVKNKGVGH